MKDIYDIYQLLLIFNHDVVSCWNLRKLKKY